MNEDALEPRLSVETGQIVGSYRVVGLIGRGGMGVVFDAVHTRLSRRAAIKVLLPQLSENPEMVSRFFTEAESANIVHHPGIVSILEFGQLPDRTVYIVMEYLEGQTLQKRLEQAGGRLGRDALRLFRQIATALASAHARGVVHRDLKPDNIMLVKDPDVPGGERTKIMDFGIAKMRVAMHATGIDLHVTRAGQVMGTPFYMSPEQFRDAGGVDDRADVYSLGVMLYQMLAGRQPFLGNSFAEIAAAHMYLTPPPLREIDPGLPAALTSLVERMLAKLPGDRPPMSQVAEELEQLVSGQAPSGRSGPLPAAPSGRPRRPVLPVVAGLSLALACSIVGYRYARRMTQRPAVGASLSRPVPALKPEVRAVPREVDLAALRGQAIEVLREGLRDVGPAIRKRSLLILGQSRDVRVASLCEPLLSDSDPGVQIQAAAALQRLGARSAAPALLALLKERGTGDDVRLHVARALAQFGEPGGEALLHRALHGRDQALRHWAVLFLADLGDRKARGELLGTVPLDEDQAAVAGKLGRAGDREATQALRASLQQGAAGGEAGRDDDRLRIAEELAKNDDAEARALLEEMAKKDGPQRMLAARVLSGLDDPSFCDLFRGCFPRSECLLPDRLLAAEGLAGCGRAEAALLAAQLPADGTRPMRLRLAAAGGILQLAASDPQLLAQASLEVLQGGLQANSRGARGAAAAALGDADPEVAVALLGRALKDREPEVRQMAAMALGRTRVRAAVPVLGPALSDDTGMVRREAIRSIGQVGLHLRRRGEPVDDIAFAVGPRAEQGDDQERLLAVTALRDMGDRGHETELRRWLHSHDEKVRRQALEALSADPQTDAQVLRDALTDPAKAVRLAAAGALARRGLADGVPVLRQALDRPGADAVTARGLLLLLGEKVAGEATLPEGPVAERVATVKAAVGLPADQALALLKQAVRDLAEEVRLAVLDVLAELPALRTQVLGQNLLRALLQDEDPEVRARAGLLFSRKVQKDPDRAPIAGPQPVAAPADGGAQGPPPDLLPRQDEASRRGSLVIEAEDGVRFQVDHRPEQVASRKQASLSLSPGKHRVSYAGGTAEVEIPAGETATLRIPVSGGQQSLADAVLAFQGGDLTRAAEQLSRAQHLLSRGRLGRTELYQLHYYQGRVYESQGRWLDAMTQYEQLKGKAPDGGPQAELKDAMERAAAHLGRVKVSEEVEGKCQTSELWLEPGQHVLDIGEKSRELRVRAGETVAVQTCK